MLPIGELPAHYGVGDPRAAPIRQKNINSGELREIVRPCFPVGSKVRL